SQHGPHSRSFGSPEFQKSRAASRMWPRNGNVPSPASHWNQVGTGETAANDPSTRRSNAAMPSPLINVFSTSSLMSSFNHRPGERQERLLNLRAGLGAGPDHDTAELIDDILIEVPRGLEIRLVDSQHHRHPADH